MCTASPKVSSWRFLRRFTRSFRGIHFSAFRLNVNDFSLRSHTCGELRMAHKGQVATIFGWLAFKRMNKFIVLRDAYGTVQARIPDERPDLLEVVKNTNYESVLHIKGRVEDRGENRNPNMDTGDVEIVVDELEVLNKAPTQFPISNRTDSSENTRLKYRYLDLRSVRLQSALRLRSEVAHSMRRFLNEEARFVEVETPTLFRRTPGGASEFIVPAPKPNLGKFYSLPQSPQQFKQLLMCGGIDRYYQIARCYRDEGSRTDRQPEFTQVDVELSFTTQNAVMRLIENLIISSWPKSMERYRPSAPFKRITYSEADRLYGIDKPDLRIPWHIVDCTADLLFLNSADDPEFAAKLVVAKGIANNITRSAKTEWKRLIQMNNNAVKFEVLTSAKATWFKSDDKSLLMEKYGISKEDAVIFAWGRERGVQWTLGRLRHLVAEHAGLRAIQRFDFVWVTDFPLFMREEGRLQSAHHPFTAPIPEHEQLIYQPENAEKIIAQHYDLVLNGVELGGGSIRIHNAKMQQFVIEKILQEPVSELAHLIQALSYGAPPHGGFALGLDRYIALLFGLGDTAVAIRDVIAFPKSKEGRDLMSNSPAKATEEQLERYGVNLRDVPDKENGYAIAGS